MIKNLETKPFYVLLLPVFFVMHKAAEFFGHISVSDTIRFIFIYCGTSLLLGLFAYVLCKKILIASMASVLLMGAYFFFGPTHSWLRDHSPIKLFSRYTFLIPAFIILLIWLFIYLKKDQRRLHRFSLFLNSVLLLYIFMDVGWLIIKLRHFSKQDLTSPRFKEQLKACDTCKKPNIYLLLFDEYANSASLKQRYGFNNDIDSFLAGKGFRIQSNSRSNYNFTPFSISSILNMSYLDDIKDPNAFTTADLTNCDRLIKYNEVAKFVAFHGYDVLNYSIFEIHGSASLISHTPLSKVLITNETFFKHAFQDLGWILLTRFRLFNKDYYMSHFRDNTLFLQHTRQTVSKKSARPRFIYAHFYMPHSPFYFDKAGKFKDFETIYRQTLSDQPKAYLEYLQYVNTQMKNLVNVILKKDPFSVIVVLGDHGYRVKTMDPYPFFYFQNLNAVYYPDKNYNMLYDSISGVNQFRVIFNKVFNQTFPLLKDTSILLKGKTAQNIK